MALVDEIEALLPQTQCEECGFKGCRPYAQALVQDAVAIDRCPPGGIPVMQALGLKLAKDPSPYLEAMQAKTRAPATAIIREAECIGCTKCIQACPVDAIIGSASVLHRILETECTGCGLCIEPCPVDCIELQTLSASVYDKNLAKNRFQARKLRLLREQAEKEQSYLQKRLLAAKSQDKQDEQKAKMSYILEALERSKAKKGDE